MRFLLLRRKRRIGEKGTKKSADEIEAVVGRKLNITWTGGLRL